MATLTETAYYTRKSIKVFIFGLAVFFVLKFFLGLGQSVWLSLFPPPPPPPTLSFGRLPKIEFPSTPVGSSSAQFTYTLETVGGALSSQTPNLKVFFIPKPAPSFGANEKMLSQASRLGFTGQPQRIPNTVNSWRFDNNIHPLQHLDYDQTNGNFHLYYEFRYDLNLFFQKTFTNQQEILNQANAFFQNLGLLGPNIPSVSYFKLELDKLMPATSLAEADAAAVTFQRANIFDRQQSYPVLPANPKQGLISLLFSGNSDPPKKILEANYFYLPVDMENWATYPAISFAQAFEILKSGQAFMAQLSTNPSSQIIIRQAYYAYFDPPNFQNYLQPVVVFSDEQGFLAYVPAISENY